MQGNLASANTGLCPPVYFGVLRQSLTSVAQSSLEIAIVLSFSVFPDAFACLYHPSQICFVFPCWGLNTDPCAGQVSIFTPTPSVICFYLFFKTLYLSIIRYLTVLWLSLFVIALLFVLILSVYVLPVFFLSCVSGYSSLYLSYASILQDLGLSRTSSLLAFSYIHSSVNIRTKGLHLLQINVQYIH